MSLDPVILNTLALDKEGNREIMIGDFHFAHRAVAGRDIPLGAANLSYLRSAWPKVEAKYPRPSFTPAIFLATALGNAASRRICAGNSGVVIAVGYVANSSTAVYRSTNSGGNWSAVTSTATVSYTSAVIQDLKYNPTTGTFLAVRASATGTYSIDRTTDNGTTWTQVRTAALTDAHNHGQCMAVTWIAGSTWVAVIRSNALNYEIISYKSTDDGVTWVAGTQTTGGGSSRVVYQVRVGYSAPNYHLFHIGDDGAEYINTYYTSTDGLTWTNRFSFSGAPIQPGGRAGEFIPLENGEMGMPYAKTNILNGLVGIARLRPSLNTAGNSEHYFYAQVNDGVVGQMGFAFRVPGNQLILLSGSSGNTMQFVRYYRTDDANPSGVYNYTSHYYNSGVVTNSNATSNCVWNNLTAPEWTFCVNTENTKLYAHKNNGQIYTIDLAVGVDRFEVPFGGGVYSYGSTPFVTFGANTTDNHVQMQLFLRGA